MNVVWYGGCGRCDLVGMYWSGFGNEEIITGRKM